MSITSLVRRNVGGLDRAVRLMLGASLVATGLFVADGTRGDPLGLVVALVGLVGVLTGITGRCPLYVPFGISSARRVVSFTSGRAPECQHEVQPYRRDRARA